jgi:hypothetical protein
MGDKDNHSFDSFIDTVLQHVSKVNDASQAIGDNAVLEEHTPLWDNYKDALDDLQKCIKHGQAKGPDKKAVKNCICEFVYRQNENGEDASPLWIESIRLRGWVEVSPAAQGTYSSNSSSSSSKSGGG